MPLIKLKSRDHEEFIVDLQIVRCSSTIMRMLKHCSKDDGRFIIVPLPSIKANILRKILVWATFHKDDAEPSSEDDDDKPKRLDDIPPWDAEFLKFDKITLFKMIKAAIYLDMKALIDVTCKVARFLYKVEMPRIKLESGDHEEFIVDLQIFRCSSTIMRMLLDCSKDDGQFVMVPLPSIKANILRKVVTWATFHKDDDDDKPKRIDDIPPWDAEFLKLDKETLLEIIKAAIYLDMRALVDVTCKVARFLYKVKMPLIKLESGDHEEFIVDLQIVRCSRTIMRMLIHCSKGDDQFIMVPLPSIKANILRKILVWATFHKDDAEPSSEDDDDKPKRLDDIPPWDAEFLKFDKITLFKMIKAAIYLDMKPLIDVTCKVARFLYKVEMPRIKLESGDHEEFIVDLQIVRCSSTIMKMLIHCSKDDGQFIMVPLHSIKANILRKILIWATFHKDDAEPSTEDDDDKPKRLDDIPPWDAEFLKLDKVTLFEMNKAAIYLDMEALVDLTRKVAVIMEKREGGGDMRMFDS